MPITHQHIDLFDAPVDIIAHQVNGRGVMGAGLALHLKRRFPHVFASYTRYCHGRTPESLLGTDLLVCADGRPGAFHDGTGQIVANLFGQAYTSRTDKMTDEVAVRAALTHLKGFAKARSLSVALPYKMGCNLGGGDWSVIEAIIADVFADYPVLICQA